MSKDRSLKPKRQSRVSKSCPGQLRGSERKKRNRQRKETVSPEVAHERYQSVISGMSITEEYHSSQLWDFE